MNGEVTFPKKRIVAVTLFSLFLLFFLLTHYEVKFFERDNFNHWFLIGFICYLVNYFIRTLRYQRLLSANPPAKQLFAVSCIHGAANYFVPVKLGELSFPILSKKILGIPLLHSSGVLVLVRVIDLLVVGVVLLLMFFLSPQVSLWIQERFGAWEGQLDYWLLAGSIVLLCAAWVLAKHPYFARVKRYFYQLGVRNSVIIIGQSFVIWVAVWANFWCLSKAVGLDLSLEAVVLVSILLLPLSLQPVQGIANLGTYELAWVSVMVLVGVELKSAVDFALQTHFLLTLHVIFLAMTGAVFLMAGDKDEQPESK